eukprot:411782-Pelagomonas_calceolata.AAC.1
MQLRVKGSRLPAVAAEVKGRVMGVQRLAVPATEAEGARHMVMHDTSREASVGGRAHRVWFTWQGCKP